MASLSPRYQMRAASEDRALILSKRCKRSRCARGTISTRYAMLRFKIRKELFDVTAFPLPRFLQALSDALVSVRMCGDIEQPLVGFCVLHDRSRLAFNRQDN